MSYFSETFIEQVRVANDIVSYVSEDTSLKANGDRYMGCCPFPDHNEKTASFSVSQSKQVYHCFGCQKSGNIFTYLQELRGMNFPETVQYLARQANLEIPQTMQKKGNSDTSISSLVDLNEKACEFYEKQLMELSSNHPAICYLKKRGYSKEIITKFRLGYAPNGNGLSKQFNSSVDKKTGLQVGLFAKNQQGFFYDNFHNRLIFPIVSTKKQVIGFGARALDDSLPKYINSKQSPIFNKGSSFYGLNESARYLRQESCLLVVEGYTDFLSLWQAGFQNIVATLGTALTPIHAKVLKRYTDSVIVVFDGDEAGRKAAERSLTLLLEESLEVKTIRLPDKQDPDDYIKKEGAPAFKTLIQNSQDLFLQVLQDKHRKLKKESRSIIYILDEMQPFLRATKKPALLMLYKQRVLDAFGNDKKSMEKVLEDSLKKKAFVNTKFNAPEPSVPEQQKPVKISLSPCLEPEKLLLVLSLQTAKFLDLFVEEKGLEDLQSPNALKIFQEIIKDYAKNNKKFDNIMHFVINMVSEKHLLFKEAYPILKEASEEDLEKIFLDCLAFLKKRKLSARSNELISEMKRGNKEEEMKQAEKIYQLKKQWLRHNLSSKK